MGRLTPRPEDLPFIRRLLLVLFLLAFVTFVYKASDLLLLAFGAGLGGVLLSAVADGIAARTPLSRPVALAIAFLGFLGTLGLMGWLFGAETARQAETLARTLPADWAEVSASLDAHPLGHLLADSLRRIVATTGVATALAGLGWGMVELLVNFIIILVAALFFAAQPDLYRRGLVLLAPRPYRPVAEDALDDVGRALRLWLLTQLVSMTLMGTMIGLGLWWAGVKAPAALGLLGGLSEFIPYVGPTLAMIPAIVIALAGPGSVWGVLAVYAAVRIVQANIITPLISQRVISVPPGLYLFLILAAGYAFGTFGLFFSGALSVTAYTLVIRLYLRETLDAPVDPPGVESERGQSAA